MKAGAICCSASATRSSSRPATSSRRRPQPSSAVAAISSKPTTRWSESDRDAHIAVAKREPRRCWVKAICQRHKVTLLTTSRNSPPARFTQLAEWSGHRAPYGWKYPFASGAVLLTASRTTLMSKAISSIISRGARYQQPSIVILPFLTRSRSCCWIRLSPR